MDRRIDAVVIGAGFYGSTIATYLKQVRKLGRVVILERGDAIMERSSFTNQARVHSGYHYLRSYTTAFRSRQNMPRFMEDYSEAIYSDFSMIYALGRNNSKVTRAQMERFCREIGAPLVEAPKMLQSLFNPALIQCAYLAEERAFNADILRGLVTRRMEAAGVEVRLGAEVTELTSNAGGARLRFADRSGEGVLEADAVFNCSYSQLQSVAGEGAPSFGLRHEITEMALVEPPSGLEKLGVTVMDGPFFSMMPFPARGLHSLSHVRYTPHLSWIEDGRVDPYARLEAYDCDSRADRMVRDAARYMPKLAGARVHASLFEVKTVLRRNDGDDGRPILMHRHGHDGRIFSILGGKIDNIYDILEKLDDETIPVTTRV